MALSVFSFDKYVMKNLKFKYSLLTLLLLVAVLPLRAQVAGGVNPVRKMPDSLEDNAKIKKQKAKAQKLESKQGKKTKETVNEFVMQKTEGKVYVFGVSLMLGDNQVYVTDINEVDSISLQKKTKFLPFRSFFSIQLQQYTEGKLGQVKQTTSVFFDTNKKKLQKRLAKTKQRLLAKPNSVVTTISTDQFHFIHPLDLMNQDKVEAAQ